MSITSPAVRPINRELLSELTLESVKVFPLAGSTGLRQDGQVDARLSNLAGLTPVGDEITYYEHIATIRHAKSRRFFVAFRETMDAFLARQRDPAKYPEWLMKSPEKQAERKIFIHLVTAKPAAVMTSHEQWLAPIDDDATFDTLAFFLHQHHVINDAVYAALR